ncbi:MAG: hypothetical protein ABIJ18_04320 [archaeon]
MKSKILTVKITPDQEQILIARARSAGFLKKSDYVRFSLFMSMPMEERIKEIHKRIFENGRN